MLYYYIALRRKYEVLNKKGVRMEFVYVAIGIVIGVVGAIVLDVDMFSKKAEDVDAKIDDHTPENEGK